MKGIFCVLMVSILFKKVFFYLIIQVRLRNLPVKFKYCEKFAFLKPVDGFFRFLFFKGLTKRTKNYRVFLVFVAKYNGEKGSHIDLA